MATVGKTTIGSIYRGAAETYIWGSKITMPEDGQISSITAFIKRNTGTYGKFAIYDSTGKKLAESSPVMLPTVESWTNFPISALCRAGQTYYFVVLADGITYILADEGIAGGGQEVRVSWQTYPTFPETIDWSEVYDYELSIYATYTPTTIIQVQLVILTTTGGTTEPAPGTYMVDKDTNVQITAIPESGYNFDHWELDGVNIGSVNPTSVTMNTNHTLLAVFTSIPPPKRYVLTVDSTPIQGVPFTVEKVV
jgi:hypothetical protein